MPTQQMTTASAALRRIALLGACLFAGIVVVIQACTNESITGVEVTSVSVTPSSATVTAGETTQFEATVVDENGVELQAAVVSWSVQSDDGDIASIDGEGLVTALSEGVATVRAEFRGASGQATLTIDPAPRIGVVPSSATLYAGVDGPVPDPAILEVINGGSGPLGSLSTTVSYPEGGAEGWLDAVLADVTAPTDLEISVLSTGLPVGAYTGTVTLTSPDAPDEPTSVPVTLSVTGFTLTETGGGTVVAEDAGSDTFNVVLDAEPASDVVLDVASEDVGAVTASLARLTFTPSNWDTPQTVTVTGVDDAVPAGDRETPVTVSVNAGLSDAAYGPAVDRSVTVTTLDDDETGFVVTETNGETVVGEAGATDTLSVVLRTRPSSNVVFVVTVSDTGEATATPGTLTFTPDDWDVPQIVVVAGVDDEVVDGPQTSTVTVGVDPDRSDADYRELPSQSVTVTTLDDDGAAIQITESGGSTVVTEAGAIDAFTVRLTSQPTANVVLSVTSSDTGEATVSPGTLTFTPGDWDEPQPVSVTGQDDDVIDGDVLSDVTVAVDAGASAPEYGDVADQIVEVTTVDDDVAGLVIEETGGGTAVSESGTSDTFTVALTAEPAADVVLGVTSSEVSEVVVDPPALTFTPGNWDQPQTVTVTGVDDDVIDGSQTVAVTLSVDAAASDPAFSGVEDDSVAVTNADDDSPGFTVTSGSSVSVSEAGDTAPITAVLNIEPASDVTLTFVVGDPLVATVDPAELTFTPANWDVPQSVTATGVDDDVDDGDQSTPVVVAVDAATSDDDFDDVGSQSVTVTAVDDDVAGFTVADTLGLAVNETGTITDAFTVVLDSEPVDDVVLDVTSGDGGEVTVDPVSLTFTAANWSTAQTLTLTGADDALVDGDQVTTVTVSVRTAESDAAYAEVPDVAASATTSDDEVGALVLDETAGLTVTEAGGTDGFTVALNAEPVENVVVQVVSDDEGEVVVSSASLTFTPENWNTPQTVTLTGVDDSLVDGTQTSTITASVVDGDSQAEFAGLSEPVTVATTDDDSAGVTLADTTGLSVTEAGSTDSFTVALDAQPTSDVVLTVTSGDTGEATVDLATLTFDGTNWDVPQTVTITGVDDDLVDG
ncbi:MAG: Ig-like domain-containing protein, partial [Gemmatimonadota bacterium]